MNAEGLAQIYNQEISNIDKDKVLEKFRDECQEDIDIIIETIFELDHSNDEKDRRCEHDENPAVDCESCRSLAQEQIDMLFEEFQEYIKDLDFKLSSNCWEDVDFDEFDEKMDPQDIYIELLSKKTQECKEKFGEIHSSFFR